MERIGEKVKKDFEMAVQEMRNHPRRICCKRDFPSLILSGSFRYKIGFVRSIVLIESRKPTKTHSLPKKAKDA